MPLSDSNHQGHHNATSQSISKPSPEIPRIRRNQLQSNRKANSRSNRRLKHNANINQNQTETKSHRTIETKVDFKSLLRIRPFSIEEQGEKNLITTAKDNKQTVRLHAIKDRLHSSTSKRQKDINFNPPSEYQFDTVLTDKNDQIDTYEAVGGEDMAWDAVMPLFKYVQGENEAKQHVIVSMGVSNSGKTFTVFGDSTHHKSKSSQQDDKGIVPRLIDDLFLVQEELKKEGKCHVLTNTNGTDIKFGLQLKMVHVHNDHIYDMLSSFKSEDDDELIPRDQQSGQKKRPNVSEMVDTFETRPISSSRVDTSLQELKVMIDKNTQDFKIKPNILTCYNSKHAQDMLNQGLKRGISTSTNMNKYSSRGHTMISIQPVLSDCSNISTNKRNKSIKSTIVGDLINVIDMAGIERTKTSAVYGVSMRESISINTTISSMLQCLRAIKDQSNGQMTLSETSHSRNHPKVIPYRQNKLTMLVQPLFSGNSVGRTDVTKMTTNIKILVAVYPGVKDYNEKKTLMNEIDSLRGLKTYRTMAQKRNFQIVDPITNTESNISTSTKEMNNDHHNTTPTPRFPSPLKRFTEAVKTSSAKKSKVELQQLQNKIERLENENKILRGNLDESNTTRISVQHVNKRLKYELAKSKANEDELNFQLQECRKNATTTNHNVRSFLEDREERWRKQTLLPSPVRDHMQFVETHKIVFCGTMNGMAGSKSPFKLSIPSKSNKSSKIEKEDLSSIEDIEDECSATSYSV